MDGPNNPARTSRHPTLYRRGVLRIWRREVVDEPQRVRRIRQERIRTAAGWPRSAQRGGVRPMDGPNNPARTSRHPTLHRRGVLRIWRREVVDEPQRVRRIRQERIRTAAGWPRSAQRGGVRPMDGPNNPARTSRHPTLHRRGVLRIWRREVVDEPQRVRRIRQERIRTAAGWPRSAQRGGVRPMDGPNNPARTSRHPTLHRRGVLRIWRREVVDEPQRVRRIRQERIRTAAGWPRSAQRGGVRPMDGPNNPARTSRHPTPHRSGFSRSSNECAPFEVGEQSASRLVASRNDIGWWRPFAASSPASPLPNRHRKSLQKMEIRPTQCELRMLRVAKTREFAVVVA